MNATLSLQNQTIIPRCRIALSFFDRFRGLMLTKSLAKGEAVLFPKCNSLHTMFMRYPLDIVFLDAELKVLEVIEGLKPWRMLIPRSKAKHALEMGAGEAKEAGIVKGVTLSCSERL